MIGLEGIIIALVALSIPAGAGIWFYVRLKSDETTANHSLASFNLILVGLLCLTMVLRAIA